MKIELRHNATEKETQAAICEYLTLRGIVFSVTDAARFRTKAGHVHYSKVTEGWPDIVAVLPLGGWADGAVGAFWGIEVKSATGKLREAQTAMHDKLRKAGALVLVARSVQDVIDFLDNN